MDDKKRKLVLIAIAVSLGILLIIWVNIAGEEIRAVIDVCVKIYFALLLFLTVVSRYGKRD